MLLKLTFRCGVAVIKIRHFTLLALNCTRTYAALVASRCAVAGSCSVQVTATTGTGLGPSFSFGVRHSQFVAPVLIDADQ